MTEISNMALIEGLIFISGDEGITNTKIAKQLNLSIKIVNDILNEMEKELKEDKHRGIMLMQTGNVFKFTTKYEHSNFYQTLIKEQTSKLSPSTLETLAIIAYKGPITKSNIEKIRGVNSDYVIAKLRARELIIEAGRSEAVGKPILYSVSKNFLDYFNLKSLDNLPPLPSNLLDKDDESELFI